MAMIFAGLGSLFTSGGAASAVLGTGALAGAFPAAPIAASGFSLAGLLSGVSTVAGIAATLGAANAEADVSKAAAIDAEAEIESESLRGIERRRQLKGAFRDALGAQDTAYAASGVDLSFGTAGQARKEANREADLGLVGENTTEETRTIRLDERAKNYRRAAKQAKSAGFASAFTRGIDGISRFQERNL